MYKKTALFAILLAILPNFVGATPIYQHKLATIVLNDEKASYMVKTTKEKVHVVTINYKNATKSSEFLQNKGINVITVKNYNKSTKNGGPGRISFKEC